MKDTTTSCTDVREKLPLHVGGDLEPDALALVRAHLARCEGCAREARAAERAREAFRTSLASSTAGSGAGLWTGLRATLEAEGRILSAARGSSAEPAPAAHEAGAASARTTRPRLRLVRRAAGFAAAAAALYGAILVGRAGVGDGPPVPGQRGPAGPPLALELPPGRAPLRAGEVRLEVVPTGAPALHDASPTLREEIRLPMAAPEGPASLAGYAGGDGRLR